MVEPLINFNTDTLPEPDDEAKKRSMLLLNRIQQACDSSGGWVRFSEFMNTALYEPGLGYYSGGLQKFGDKGDFITAPEVSPMFGQCLANQVAEVLNNFKQINNEAVNIIEFGAGSGVLAVDILRALEKNAVLPEKYFIVELSAELIERQKQTLKDKAPHLIETVEWLNQLPENVTNALVIANEVLDAMPVECFKVSDPNINSDTDMTVESLLVGVENGKLVSRYELCDASLLEKIKSVQQRSDIHFSDSYCSEYNPVVGSWLAALENKISNLVVLLIDYGYNEEEYYHPDRENGTLMCYYRHHAHDNFFWWPGLQDITAFVNFTDVAYCAVDLGMEVSGYTTQAAFLLANGLSELHESQVTDDAHQQIKLSQQIKTLTLPSEMGDRFKVMALTKNYYEPLTGFSMLDLRNRL